MLRTMIAAMTLAALAAPAAADWESRAEIDTATAFVEAEGGRRFALACAREAPGMFDLVLDMTAKRRLLQDPAPLGFTIAGRRYRYAGTMEEGADGLRRITVTAPFDDDRQTRMRRDLKRGIRVSVEDQSSYRLFSFALRGSRAAVESFEEACDALWTNPRPEPVPVAEAPDAPAVEPARSGAWRLEADGDRALAFAEGLAGDRIGLACGADGRVSWAFDVVEAAQRPPSLLPVRIEGPGSGVDLVASRAAPRERGLGSYAAPFDRVAQRAILRDLGRGEGEISVRAGAGGLLAALPLDGAPAILPRLLEVCRARR